MWNSSMVWAVEPHRFQAFLSSVYRREAASGANAASGTSVPTGGGVAVIPIRGIILKDAGWLEAYGAVSLRKVEDALLAASSDPGVSKIVMLIDSPGGSVDGLYGTAQIMRQVNKTKPIVAVVDGLAASAGYYLASQATEITAGKMDEVGSIGVRVLLYDFSKLFTDAGVRPVLIDTGEFKSIGAMGVPISEAQQAEVRKIVDAFFADFKASVRKGRSMTEPQVNKVADGRVFLGEEARELGLIDRVQSARDAVAGVLAGIAKPRLRVAEMSPVVFGNGQGKHLTRSGGKQ